MSEPVNSIGDAKKIIPDSIDPTEFDMPRHYKEVISECSAPRGWWTGWLISYGHTYEVDGDTIYNPPHLINQIVCVCRGQHYYAPTNIYFADLERVGFDKEAIVAICQVKMQSAAMAVFSKIGRDIRDGVLK